MGTMRSCPNERIKNLFCSAVYGLQGHEKSVRKCDNFLVRTGLTYTDIIFPASFISVAVI
jgi:hypothetical protein